MTLDEILATLDLPLRKTKKAVSGDEQEWFAPSENPSELDHQMYALGNTALDLAGDPLNFIGGPLKMATKGARQLPGALAAASNYIPGFYGPTGMKELTGLAAKGKEALVKRGVGEEAAEGAAQMGKGFSDWGLDSVLSSAKHMLSPTSRATWDELGTTAPAQKRILGLLDDATDTRAVDKSVAQVQYEKHLNTQGRAGAGSTAAADEIAARSFVQDYTKYTKGDFRQALEKSSNTTYATPNGPVVSTAPAPQATNFAAEHIAKRQGMDSKDTTFVVKNPGAGNFITGGHYSDVIASGKNPAISKITKIFRNLGGEAGEVDAKTLKEALKAEQVADAANKGKRQKGMGKIQRKLDNKQHPAGWHLVKDAPDDGGVWLEGGNVGAAVTEGGIYWLMRVAPDGKMTGWMADKHDFLENMLPIKKAGVLPEDVVAVSPAMTTSVHAIRKTPAGKPAGKYSQTPAPGSTEVYAKNKQGYADALVDHATARPSAAGVNRQRLNMAGSGLIGAGLLGDFAE